MIEILQEITDWGEYSVANGVYHVDSAGRLVQHNDTVFKVPLKGFSKARRKFKKIGDTRTCTTYFLGEARCFAVASPILKFPHADVADLDGAL